MRRALEGVCKEWNAGRDLGPWNGISLFALRAGVSRFST